MARNVTLNGTTYSIPEPGDVDWGSGLTRWVAAANSAIESGGGGGGDTSLGWVNVKDYGAIGDGVADDTAAFQAAFDAAVGGYLDQYGKTVYVPFGFYRITDTITVSARLGFRLIGDSALASQLFWAGSAGLPFLVINSSQHVSIRDICLYGLPAAPPSTMLYFAYSPVVYAGTAFDLRNISITGQNLDAFEYGIRWSADYGNNSEVIYDNVNIGFFSEAGVRLDGTQQKAHKFYGCGINGLWDGTPGAPDRIGGKWGIYAVNGNYLWYGGNVSGCTEAAFTAPGYNDPLLIDGCNSENCYRFVDFGEVSSPSSSPIIIRSCRASAFDHDATGFIRYVGSGPCVIDGNAFETDATPPKIKLTVADSHANIRITNNTFRGYGVGTVDTDVIVNNGPFPLDNIILHGNKYHGVDQQVGVRDEILNNSTDPSSNIKFYGVDKQSLERSGSTRYFVVFNALTAAATSQTITLCTLPRGTRLKSLHAYHYGEFSASGNPNVHMRVGITPGGQELLLDYLVGGTGNAAGAASSVAEIGSVPSDLGPLLASAPASGVVIDRLQDRPIYVTFTRSSGNLGNGATTNFVNGRVFFYFEYEVQPRYVLSV